MTFKDLKTRLSDPIILGGLLLLIIGEVQAQSDVLLSWLGPEAAGRVLSLIGVFAVIIKWIQALPAVPAEPEDPNDQAGFARPLLLALLLAIAVPITLSLQGCESMQTVQQLSFDQKLQLSIDQTAIITRSVGSAYDAGLIDEKQASAYLGLVKEARGLFAIAIELKDADTRTAEGQLQLANDILLQLQRYLSEVES